jgi:predicted nucleic acid-binding protein
LNFSPHQEQFWVEAWCLQSIIGLSTQQLLDALVFRNRYQVVYWDGIILAAAKEAKDEKLHSEELQQGQHYEEVEVIDPFL